MDSFNIGPGSCTIILFILTLSLTAGSNINCDGKAFHCVNSTHFKICVDLGGGVSTTVDELIIPCPRNTVCKQYNLFECEYELTTTLPPVTIQGEVRNEQFEESANSGWEQMEITLFPMKKQPGMELSEKYYNKVNETSASILTDENPVTSSNTNELHTSSKSDINKTLNISRSIDKQLTFSTTDLGTGVTSPLNSDTLVTDVDVSSNNKTEIPVSYSNKQHGLNIDSLKNDSLDSISLNSLALDARLVVTEETNVPSNSSDTVSILHGYFREPILQKNTSLTSNISRLIKLDNVNQDHNLDILFEYNKSQFLNSNNKPKSNTNTTANTNSSNSTTFNVFMDEFFYRDVPNANKKLKQNSTITFELPGQLAATTASTEIVSGNANKFSSTTPLNTADAVETPLKVGFNTTRKEKIGVTDGYIMTTTSTENSVVRTNGIPSQITGLNYGESPVTLNDQIDETILKKGDDPSYETKAGVVNLSETVIERSPKNNRTPKSLLDVHDTFLFTTTTTTAIESVIYNNIDNSYISSTVPKFINDLEEKVIIKTMENVSDLSSPLLLNKSVIPKNVTSNYNIFDNNSSTIVDTLPTVTTDNILSSDYSTISKSRRTDEYKSIAKESIKIKNDTWPESVKATVATDLANSNSITISKTDYTITTVISNRLTSLKPISDLTSNNKTFPESFKETVATDFDNNNTIITETDNNITTAMSNRVTSFKPTSHLISDNKTFPTLFNRSVTTDLDDNDTRTTEINNNITTIIFNRDTSLKPISDLISNDETIPIALKGTVTTDIDNNNTTTKIYTYITTAMSERDRSSKPISDLISNNEIFSKPLNATVAIDIDNNNTTTTDKYTYITVAMPNKVTSLKIVSDFILNIETFPKTFNATVTADFDSNNTTTTEINNNITTAMFSKDTSLKSISDLISNNGTFPKPFNGTVTTDIENNNTTTTETFTNITTAMSDRSTSSKPISDLISNNNIFPKPLNGKVAIDIDNNNKTTTENYTYITLAIPNSVTSLKTVSDLISNIETFPKTLNGTVTADLDNNNTTTTIEINNNITTAMFSKDTSLKPISDLVSKNEIFPKKSQTVTTDIDNNNTVTTERVMSLKPMSDLISKNVSFPSPLNRTLATDIYNNKTTTDTDNDVTTAMSDRFTSLKPILDFISINATSSKPFNGTVTTDIDNNNTTTTEIFTSITTEMPNRVTTLKTVSDLISNIETFPKTLNGTITADLDNNNTTTTIEINKYITTAMFSKDTSLKPISDLVSKNEIFPKKFNGTVTTDIDNNNTVTTERVMSLKPISDLISKNEFFPKPFNETVTTDIDNNITVTTETDSSIIMAIDIENNKTTDNDITTANFNSVTSLKPISHIISYNITFPKPFNGIVNTDRDNNNTTTTETDNDITTATSNRVTSFKPISSLILKNEIWPTPVVELVATDLEDGNKTIEKTANNTKIKIYDGVTSLRSISGLTPIKENLFETISTKLSDYQNWNKSAVNLSSSTKSTDYTLKTKQFDTTDSVGSISTITPITNYLERNTTSIVTTLPITINNLTMLKDRSLGSLDINRTHNDNMIKPVRNSLPEINKDLISNSTVMNIIHSEHEYNYETGTKSDTASITVKYLTGMPVFEAANSIDVTNNTFAVIDRISKYPVISDNSKIIDNTSKLESAITINPTTQFDLNYTSSKNIISSEIVTTPSSESDKKEMNNNQINYKNDSNNVGKILSKNIIGNSILTERWSENLPVTNNVSLSAIFKITDKNISLSDIEQKHSHVKDNLVENSLTTSVISSGLNNTDKSVASSVSNNSKSITIMYLSSTVANPRLMNNYNVTYNYFNKNITLTRPSDKTTAPNKHITEYNVSNQTNNSVLVPEHVSNIKYDDKTEYLVINRHKQDTTTKKVNDTLLKELFHNFSEPSLIERNNVSHYNIMKNVTSISADRNSAPKNNNDTKKVNNTTNNKPVIDGINNANSSKLAGYFHLIRIPNFQFSGNATRLQAENANLSLITDKINKSITNGKNNVNNINSSNIFSVNSNNLRIVNTILVGNVIKPTNSLTHDRNISEVKNLTTMRTKTNDDLNTTSESSTTVNNLFINMLSQKNKIKNETYDVLTNIDVSPRIPIDNFLQSNGTLNILKMATMPSVSDITNLELIRERDIISTSEHNIRSNGTEKKQFKNSSGPLELLSHRSEINKKSNQKDFITPTTNNYYSDSDYRNSRTNLEFRCTKRGKYSNTNDCNKFYICIGRIEPIVGVCPRGTVFSEFLKQCTKNVTHCIRNNQCQCTAAGRFNNILSNSTYFICAKNTTGFIRFTLQCQKGYYLDKNNIKCTPVIINISISDENSSKNSKESTFEKSKEMERASANSQNYFECKNEGKFKDPQDCSRYYICKKGRKSTFRRKIRKCDSDEVFHRKKKKCVDVESYECDIQM